jgi:nucleoside-diphosphate-sugar epimerase
VRVLVTGHKGFVGSHFYRHYKDAGEQVLGIDIRGKRHIDARDFFRTSDVKFDLVIHCAAVVGGRVKIDGDPLGVSVDLAIDAEMFQWARRTHVGRIVYFSSSAIYPIHLQGEWGTPLTEAHLHFNPPWGEPDQSYGWTKYMGEYQARMMNAEGIPTHVFRPFSGYGEDQDLDYPFPSYVERAVRHAHPFEVWGTGKQVRDFVHIDDVMGTVLTCLDQDFRGPLNIGTGRWTDFDTLARMCLAEVGYTTDLLHFPDMPVGVLTRVADTALLESVRIPKVTLEEGIRRAVASHG